MQYELKGWGDRKKAFQRNCCKVFIFLEDKILDYSRLPKVFFKKVVKRKKKSYD